MTGLSGPSLPPTLFRWDDREVEVGHHIPPGRFGNLLNLGSRLHQREVVIEAVRRDEFAHRPSRWFGINAWMGEAPAREYTRLFTLPRLHYLYEALPATDRAWFGQERHLRLTEYAGTLEAAVEAARRWWSEPCNDPMLGEVVVDGLVVVRVVDRWTPGSATEES